MAAEMSKATRGAKIETKRREETSSPSELPEKRPLTARPLSRPSVPHCLDLSHMAQFIVQTDLDIGRRKSMTE